MTRLRCFFSVPTRQFIGQKRQFAVQKPELPNYFISLRISSSKILDQISAIQSEILSSSQNCRLLKQCMILPRMLHITAFVFHVKDDNELLVARKTLEEYQEDLNRDFKAFPPS